MVRLGEDLDCLGIVGRIAGTQMLEGAGIVEMDHVTRPRTGRAGDRQDPRQRDLPHG
jgi:hypothetical protein